MSRSIHAILFRNSENHSDADAVLAVGRPALSHGALYQLSVETRRLLRTAGVRRDDRVVIVLPNGPEMATAFLSVSSSAIAAPLNPSYRAADFEFYLDDLNPAAVVVLASLNSPVRDVARTRGIRIIELEPDLNGPAGLFRLLGDGGSNLENVGAAVPEDPADPDDTALVLHTSGTTSRPKIVPLTHANVCNSADNISRTLLLSTGDRCLNVMPLFHIHGLIGAVLSSIHAGASVVCTPGFQSDQFFGWLRDFSPSWYTAVPTIHQAVLAGVADHRDAIAACPLRLIRSSSSSLPPVVMLKLEEAFDVPVIESYGMTEAAHQMASNPLPPGVRKPGTVGVAAGPDVAIMDKNGTLLEAGQTGEIVIRGNNVTAGYAGNPLATEQAFTNGWFRTGDEGILDADGYLTITGRLKEMVNRGGEKIAPREIDEALLNHPDVEQAVAFALPHETLGEDLAAAVTLRNGATVTEVELRKFAFAHLPDFKVPSRIVIVERIPKGPTGKLQRVGLAKQLESELGVDYVAPRDPFELALSKIWMEALKLDGTNRVGINDNFFSMGGDSLAATAVVGRIQQLVEGELQPAVLFQAPTIAELSDLLRTNERGERDGVVALQPHGHWHPLFCVPGHGGDVFTFLELSRRLGPDRPVYALRFPVEAETNDHRANAMVPVIAEELIAQMKSVQPQGPYHLLGFCFGGEVMAEMVSRLQQQGETTPFAAVVHAPLTGSFKRSWYGRRQQFRRMLQGLSAMPPRRKGSYAVDRLKDRLRPVLSRHQSDTNGKPETLIAAPFPRHCRGRLTLFRPRDERSPEYVYEDLLGWDRVFDEVELVRVPGNRLSVFQEPHVAGFAEALAQCLVAWTIQLDESRLTIIP